MIIAKAPSAPEDGASFGSTHFGAAKLGHVGRTRRLVRAADLIAQHPGGTLPKKIADPTELAAFYRLANRPEVTHQAVLEPHRRRTLDLMRRCDGPVLVIHDTTELDYTGLTSLTGLGQIGNGHCRGYLCHNSLAVRASDRGVIGLANQALARRDDVPKGESRSARRARETRESRLWALGSAAVGPAPEGAMWVDVCDRGADVFEYLDFKHRAGGHYIVRSKHDRNCEIGAELGKLHARARGLEPLGGKVVAITAGAGRSARRARVLIASAPISIAAPSPPSGEHGTGPLSLSVVIVREIDAPPGVEPLEWVLLTDLAVDDLAGACLAIEWYAMRPIVEEYHKAMKTGCGVESPQFTTEAALRPTIALLSVVAVSLLGLRDAGRDEARSQGPATELMPPLYVEVLSGWRHGEARMDWTIREFLLALGRLGGHQNRKGDGAPGWLVLWRGWESLQSMVAGAAVVLGRDRGPG